MVKDDHQFQPRFGKSPQQIGGFKALGNQSFYHHVIGAVRKTGQNPRNIGFIEPKKSTGRYNARGRGAKIMPVLPRAVGWTFDAAFGQCVRMRSVSVSVYFVKSKGTVNPMGLSHLRYLRREGVGREGGMGQLYNAEQVDPDGRDFLQRGAHDKHQFRMVVAAEDGAQLDGLQDVTRKLMRQVESDLETRLDWVAVDHHNTGHPHTHIVFRGVTQTGTTLNIAGDYICHGIRTRASEIVTQLLGVQCQSDINYHRDLEVKTDRFTNLDRTILAQAGDDAVLNLARPSDRGSYPHQCRLLRRLEKLAQLGLVQQTGLRQWTLAPNLEDALTELGERNDIVETIHRTLDARGLARSLECYAIHRRDDLAETVTGRIIGKGFHLDGHLETTHLVVDGMDGRVHYVELAKAAAAGLGIDCTVVIDKDIAKAGRQARQIAADAPWSLQGRDDWTRECGRGVQLHSTACVPTWQGAQARTQIDRQHSPAPPGLGRHLGLEDFIVDTH